MKAVFLDRDGTINRDPPNERVERIAEVKLFPDTIRALKILAEAGFKAIIVTNQAGIAEGLISDDEFQVIQAETLKLIKPSGLEIVQTYYCPYGVNDGCACRKPKPKMILDAIKDFNIEPESTFMVGDTLKDVGAGKAAGTKTILVNTGNHEVKNSGADYVASNLLDAAQYVVAH